MTPPRDAYDAILVSLSTIDGRKNLDQGFMMRSFAKAAFIRQARKYMTLGTRGTPRENRLYKILKLHRGNKRWGRGKILSNYIEVLKISQSRVLFIYSDSVTNCKLNL